MATTFKVGDKVEHRSFGAGEIAFGPFDHFSGASNYLMRQEDGNHVFSSPDALTHAVKFKVGDKVLSYGDEYTVKAGPFNGITVKWYAVTGDDGTDYRVNEGQLSPAPAPAAEINIGDRVRVVKDDDRTNTGQFIGMTGVISRLNAPSHRLRYNVRLDAGQGAPFTIWNVAEVELVDGTDTYTYDGVTYDLTAKYRDHDGDVWAFKRFGDEVHGDFGEGATPTLGGRTLRSVVGNFGPLTRVNG